jgi:PAS domain-containing protein
MEKHIHHDELITGAYDQLHGIFEESDQAIYLYLDDTHKVCNKKFSRMLGYESPEKWLEVEEMILDVDEKHRERLVNAYQAAMDKMIGSSIQLQWHKKSGGAIMTNVILVPYIYEGHLFALHFISKI